MAERTIRTEMLIGTEAVEKLGNSHVAVFGLGGVGSWCAEALVRSGVGELTIVDDDGNEYELEVLSTLEYNGETYMAVIPAGSDEDQELEVSILKSVEEDGESILTAIEDEAELEAVYDLIMDSLYEEDEEE